MKNSVQGEPVGSVYPSKDVTVWASDPDNTYGEGGAHSYTIQNCTGFKDGETQYDNSWQSIQFVKTELDGSTTPGFQSEQLIITLMDRHEKMNKRFPSEMHAEQMSHLQAFLDLCRKRVDDRVQRNVMGTLQK
jgi:hypothetical protein